MLNTLPALLHNSTFGVALKARNTVYDAVFYDVSALTFDEWVDLNPLSDRKGKIIVVSPSGSGRRESIRHYASAEAFYNSDDWESVFAIAVTGVGSSVIGTAAFARNVADACKETIGGDVAGIVSGYGVCDALQEALGGYFFYGMLNQSRYMMETGLDNVSAILSDLCDRRIDARRQWADLLNPMAADYVPIGPDVSELVLILRVRYLHLKDSKIRLLIGHSKGNLLIADALDYMSEQLKTVPHDAFGNLAAVTLGAVVDIADDVIAVENQYQFLGTLDGLGLFNSRWSAAGLAPHKSLLGKWHSLNRKLPLHTDVFDILRDEVEIPPPPPIERGPEGQDMVGLRRRACFNRPWEPSPAGWWCSTEAAERSAEHRKGVRAQNRAQEPRSDHE